MNKANSQKCAIDTPRKITTNGHVSKYGFEQGFTQTIRRGGCFLIVAMPAKFGTYSVCGWVEGMQTEAHGLTSLVQVRRFVREQFGQEL